MGLSDLVGMVGVAAVGIGTGLAGISGGIVAEHVFIAAHLLDASAAVKAGFESILPLSLLILSVSDHMLYAGHHMQKYAERQSNPGDSSQHIY